MNTRILAVLAASCFALSCAAALADLQPGVRLKAGGDVIDVEVGHLVPCAVDWNADGKKDLLIGNRCRSEKPSSGGNVWLFMGK